MTCQILGCPEAGQAVRIVLVPAPAAPVSIVAEVTLCLAHEQRVVRGGVQVLP